MNSQYFQSAYCKTCQCSVIYLKLIGGHTIAKDMTADGPTEYDECFGPFTFDDEQEPNNLQ